MSASLALARIFKSTLAALAMLALLGSTAAAAHATDGTIKAIKGGDRKVDETSNRSYALPVGGALFEYTSSAAKAADPASTGWTAFPSVTGASGTATVSVPAGTYFVRERTVPAGFSNFGPVKSLYFNPSSDVPSAARPYVAKVKVEHGEVTEAYPNRSASSDPDDWYKTYGGDSGSPFVNVRDNQSFPTSCGVNILLVLDRSGSIEPFKSTYRDAAKAFVDGLAGTPTQIGILSFSAGSNGVNSYQDGSGSSSLTRSPLDLGAAGSAAALNDTIDDVYASPSGGTNWDRALQKASQAKGFSANAATGQTANPDVVVFITDGNPTARSTDGSDSGSDVDLIDLTAGMASANLVKSQQARALTKLKLYALGVGSGVTADNLKAVSGPVLGEDYETPTLAQLTAKLKELAARTCGARVFVRKRVAGSAADQPNWGFTATSNGGSVSYLDGNRRTHATDGGTVQTGVILTPLPAAGGDVTVAEDAGGQPLSDFQLDSVSCRTGGYDGAPVTPLATPALGVKLSVQRGSEIYCTFTNSPKQPNLTVTKTPDDGVIDAAQDAEFTIVVKNTGGGVAKDVVLTDTLPAQGSWSISSNPGGCSIASGVLTCEFGDLAAGASKTVKVKTATSNHACATYVNQAATVSADNHTSVSDGGKITCRKDAKVTVVKQLAPASDGGRFDLKVGATVVAAGAGHGGQGSTFVDPGTHTVSEAGAGGTDLAKYGKSIACVKNGQPAESGHGASLDIAVGYEDKVVCTITNTRLGTIEIEKQTDPDEDGGTAFGFTSNLDPQSFQLSDDGIRTIANVEPNAGGTAYEVTEAAAPGYRLSAISCGGDADSAGSTATRTASIHVSPGETVRCTFTNTKLVSGTLVVKEGTLKAHHGDQLTYTFDVTNTGNSPLHDVVVTDDRCAPVTRVSGDDLLDPGEHWTYTCSYTAPPEHAAGEEDPIHNTVTATAKDEQDRPVQDTDTHDTDLLHPDIEIDKQVDRTSAQVGDKLAYTFVVTNAGDTPLAVTFSDPRCDAGTLTGPAGDADQDSRLDVGETWTYACSHVVTVQDPNPLPNTAKVTGEDELGGKDSDEDSTSVELVKPVLNPAIDIEKSGPATATAGTALAYTLTVTNPGDVPFASQLVVVTDPRCEAPPAGPSTGADASPGQLDPGDTWIYTCTAQTAGHPAGPFVNTATVTAKDAEGRQVTDTDEFTTILDAPKVPQSAVETQQVLSGPRTFSASARLRGPSGCVTKPFRATVRGSRISRVTFYRDGKRIRRIDAKRGQRAFSVKVRAAGAQGVHRITAKVRFKAGSRPRTRTLRLSYQRCRKQVVQPRFTG